MNACIRSNITVDCRRHTRTDPDRSGGEFDFDYAVWLARTVMRQSFRQDYPS